MSGAEKRTVVVDGGLAGRECGGPPGQHLSHETATLRLWQLVSWLRDKLERLHRDASGEEIRASLHALVRACDPATNPRLRAAIEGRVRREDATLASPRPLDRDQLERLHARLRRCDRCLQELLFENGQNEQLQGAADHSKSVLWFLEQLLDEDDGAAS